MIAEGISLLVLVGVLTAFYFYFTQEQPKRITREDVAKLRGENVKKNKKKKQKKNTPQKKKNNYALTKKKPKKIANVTPHKLLVEGYKRHRGEITGIGFYKKNYVFTASTDKMMRLWKIGAKDGKGSSEREVEGYSMRGASIITTPDGKTKAVAQTFRKLHFFSVKKIDGKVAFKKKSDCKLDLESEALMVKFNSQGTWMVVVGYGILDPKLKIMDTTGRVLYENKVNEGHLVQACLSSCDRWIAVVGGMQSVNLWHVTSKLGVFIACNRALQLRGHKGSVTCVTFSPCCTKAITSSQDGKARIFHIDVRWKDREDPKLQETIDCGHPLDYAVMSSTHICACGGTKMFIYDLASKKLLDTVENVQHTVDGKVTSMEFTEDEQGVLIGGTDRHAYLYRMPSAV